MKAKERAAMQQAVDAWDLGEFNTRMEEAIAALREALDSDEEDKPLYRKVLREMLDAHEQPVSQEPTVSDGVCGGCAKKASDGWALYCVECWEKAEQTEQEPIGYVIEDNDYEGSKIWAEAINGCCLPVYLAPPKQELVDLTDDEILILNQSTPLRFARAVIAADRKKNK